MTIHFHGDIHIHGGCHGIQSKLESIMATIQDLVQLATSVANAVPGITAAVDALEAKVTAALAQLGTVPPDVQTGIDQAFDVLTQAVAGLSAATADATDGVDEAATTP